MRESSFYILRFQSHRIYITHPLHQWNTHKQWFKNKENPYKSMASNEMVECVTANWLSNSYIFTHTLYDLLPCVYHHKLNTHTYKFPCAFLKLLVTFSYSNGNNVCTALKMFLWLCCKMQLAIKTFCRSSIVVAGRRCRHHHQFRTLQHKTNSFGVLKSTMHFLCFVSNSNGNRKFIAKL